MQARPSNARSPEAVEDAAWMELDASALRANLEALQRLVGEHVRIIPSLKANAYGHGAVWVAQEFEAAGVGMLATGSFADAVAMRQAGVRASIIHFGTYLAAAVPQLLAHDLTPTVWDLATATAVSEAAQGPTAVHVKVDAGFGRVGVPIEEAEAFVTHLVGLPNVVLEGLYAHLPFSNDAGRTWARACGERFAELLERLERRGISIPVSQVLASSGLTAGLDTVGNAVSPGQALLGLTVYHDAGEEQPPLRPVLTAVRARLIQVTTVHTERSIWVGGSIPVRPGTTHGVVAIGAAHGLRLSTANRMRVLIAGAEAPVIGVSLEHTLVDLTGVPAAAVGDAVTLVGRDGDREITIGAFAGSQDSVPLEALTALSDRLPRRVQTSTTHPPPATERSPV